MIEKCTFDSDTREQVIDITEKLNEVIDYINNRAVLDKIAEACEKAIRTGSHADLKAWLDLRRKYL